MNEQERLQRIIDILADNAHEMYVETRDENAIIDVNMNGIQIVAKEIMNAFKLTQKDRKSRRERALDEQFERMNVKPQVYHFLNIGSFKAVTVAQIPLRGQEGWGGYIYDYQTIRERIQKYPSCECASSYPLMSLLCMLKKMNIYGVAICNKDDVFNKYYGRMKAKGRLLQHILKEV